ncbi:MAG: hypothetical protein R3Y24_10975 [Eubacteriales bacterium]
MVIIDSDEVAIEHNNVLKILEHKKNLSVSDRKRVIDLYPRIQNGHIDVDTKSTMSRQLYELANERVKKYDSIEDKILKRLASSKLI